MATLTTDKGPRLQQIQIESGFFAYVPGLSSIFSLLKPAELTSSNIGPETPYPIAVDQQTYETFYRTVSSLLVEWEINLFEGVDIGETGFRTDYNGTGSQSLNLPVGGNAPLAQRETRQARRLRNVTSSTVTFRAPRLLLQNVNVGEYDVRNRQWNSEGNLVSDTTTTATMNFTLDIFQVINSVLFDDDDHYPRLVINLGGFFISAAINPPETKNVPFADWGDVTAGFGFGGLQETGDNFLSISIDGTF